MIEYLEKNKASTGIDPSVMDINIDAVQFERDTARASVSFLIKDTTNGMQGNYTDSRWEQVGNVTRQNMTVAPHGADPINVPPADQAERAAASCDSRTAFSRRSPQGILL